MNLRWIVLKILDAIEFEGIFVHDAIENHTNDDTLTKQDRSFIKRIVFGVIEHRIYLDYVIDKFSKIKVNKMKPAIRHIMRLSVYQMLYMDSVPDSAVCNEAVKLVKKRNMYQLTGFVNGVLRSIMRGHDDIKLPDKASDIVSYLSVKYSFDKAMVAYLLESYSKKNVEKFLKVSNEEAPLTIRVNLSKTTPEQLKNTLKNEGVTVTSAKWLDYAMHIDDYDSLTSLESFNDGQFTVQDESSMLVGEVAHGDAVKCSDGQVVVLDICSAPGGKALHMADVLGDKGHVKAFDVSDYKLGLIKENVNRLGVSNIEVAQGDGTVLNDTLVRMGDIVIADVPCSGLGIIRKKPDIKWHTGPDKIHELVQIQREILSNVKNYVKPGGTLVYSTCTITKEENEQNVDWFLSENSDFELVKLSGSYVNDQNGMVTLMPISNGPDGFYIAKLRRKM